MLLTKKEMLEQWRLRHCLDASGMTGTADDQFDRTESDLIETAGMDDWYANLLSMGDPELIEPTDITGQIELAPGQFEGEWSGRLPDNVKKVVEVDIAEPGLTAEIVESGSRMARLMTDEFAPIPTQKPLAFMQAGCLKVFIVSEKPIRLNRVMAIVTPAAGFYSVTQKGLSTIPKPDLTF